MPTRTQDFCGTFKARLAVVCSYLCLIICLLAPSARAAVDTFQEGVSGYAGTQDTYLDEQFPATARGGDGSVLVENGGGSDEQQGLIRFDNIFGAGVGQIPLGSVINSASLSVNVTNNSSSGAQIRFHRMLVTWPETATWNSMTGGIQTDDVEALSAFDAQVSDPASSGPETITGLAAALQAWSDGASNFGWAFISDDGDGWDFDSSEDGTAANRPLLTVDWTPHPCPGGVVSTTTDSLADGTLRSCIIWANGNPGADTITVPAGTYTIAIAGQDDTAAAGDLDLTEDITINGAGSTITVIDGGAIDRIFDILPGVTADLSDLTIRNGNPGGAVGGGIRNAANLILSDAVVTGNVTTGNGGGIFQDGSTTSVSLTNVTVDGNSADTGGGLWMKDLTAATTLTDVTFSGNSATTLGGGIFTEATAFTLSRTTLDGNTAKEGGGIYNKGSGFTQTLTNVTLSGNSATDLGGGLFNEAGVLTLTNGTITGNLSAVGGGLHVKSGSPSFRNTIIANSPTGGDCSGSLINLGNNLDSDGTCGFATTADPLLGLLQDNGGSTDTHELLPGSPAIDTGTNTGCPATDQRGTMRPVDGDGDTVATCDIGAFEFVPSIADLTLTKTDAPDPAPLNGPLLYTLLITNNGPSTATGVTVIDTLPASVTLVSAIPNQGSCSGVAVVTCNLGAILNSGTASIEILVTTNAAGTINNTASVTANEIDLVPADNTANTSTDVVVGGTTDIPLTQYARMHGFLDYAVIGGTLRTGDGGGQRCDITTSSSQTLASLPVTATIRAAYLYWAASGVAVDATVTLDAAPVTADRTWEADFVLGANTYEFFGGFEDVTAQVTAKGNGLYTFAGLTIDNGNPWCQAQAVLGGWSMYVIYEDPGVSGKTLVHYDGFDLERNGSTSYLLTGIYASAPPEAKTTPLLWEGDAGLGTGNEQLLFNGSQLSDALNPASNVYNSTINSLAVSDSYGVDLDTFDVSGLVADKDTLATTQVDTGPDLVILNAVLLQVKTNIIAGTVFEDVNYGGGVGRDLATAVAAAPTFTVPRPGATVELYDAGGNIIRTTVTDANGDYGFTGLPDGNYTVRVVNETVTSSRPGATGTEWPVQTFRTDATGPAVLPVTTEVGGANPTAEDDPANTGAQNLAAITAQSLAPVTISASIAKAGVDFGYNFDTIVNTNNTGQGSLDQFIDNSNALTNANLAQDGLTAGKEHSLFMIPSDADPLGRPQDPNFDAGRGVAVITLSTALPGTADADTSIDGTTQTADIGDTNAGLLGVGGTVGVDGLALSQVAAPEVEIRDGAAIAIGLQIQGNDTTVRGLSMFGFGNGGTEAAIVIDDGFSDTLIENNVLGAAATSFTDPGAASRNHFAIHANGGDFGTIRDNLIGFCNFRGVTLVNASTNWTIEGNEIRDCGLGVTDGVGITVNSSSNAVTGNLIVGSAAQGVTVVTGGGNVLSNNTVSGNGVGTAGGVTRTAGIAARAGVTAATIDRNIVQSNYGAGIQVNDGAFGVQLTQNSILDNGTIVARDSSPATGQVGIDLNAPGDDINLGTPPYFTLNDVGDGDPGGNNLLNFPVITSAVSNGVTTTVTGTLNSTAGTTFTLEFFSSATADASGYGEGETYRGTDTVLTDGGGNGGFTTVLPVAVPIGHAMTITSTDPSDNTSEFSLAMPVATDLAITKRAFFPDGTPIPTTATVPNSVLFHFLLYINNPDGGRLDVSLQDVLDPGFAYETGSLRIDNSLAACAAPVCTPAEEASIFASTVAAPLLSDAVDADAVSFTGGDTIDAGNENAANTQLDIAANNILALLLSVRFP